MEPERDEILYQLKQHAPLDTVVRVHTFKGSLEGELLRDVTIEVQEWMGDQEGQSRGYYICATNADGKRVCGPNPRDEIEMAVRLFPWHELQNLDDEESS